MAAGTHDDVTTDEADGLGGGDALLALLGEVSTLVSVPL
jgi:hypothetical protein